MTLTDALSHALHRIAYHDWDEATDDPPVMDVGDLSDSGNGTAFELASAILADPGFREALTAAVTEALIPHFGPSYFPGLTDVTIIGRSPELIAADLVDHLLPEAAATSVAILGADPEHDGEHE